MARNRTIVRYDVRGTGLSQREVTDHTLEAQVADVEAVIGRLGLETFDLIGAAGAGPVAIALAARRPEQVSRLVLWCAWAASEDISSPRLQAWRGLIDQDWDLMADTCAQIVLGWSGGEMGRVASKQLQSNVTPEIMKAALVAARSFDSTDLLGQVQAATLVLHRRHIAWIPHNVPRQIAINIPNSRLTLLDGESSAPYLGDMESTAEAIIEFLDEGKAEPRTSSRCRHSHGYPDNLTEREVEVLRHIAVGQTNAEIAKELFLSIRTVERHIGNIYGKINARGRANATAYALTHELL
ncbi:MAG: hypothetical protein IID61_11935 [SAR324 cluster bacterium]|nr:hypothetical protein [SAR324 cluster bacterium]